MNAHQLEIGMTTQKERKKKCWTSSRSLGFETMKKRKLGPAGKLIEKGWCQGTYAKNKEGQEVSYTSTEAVCWCTIGAIKASYVDDFPHRLALRDFLYGTFALDKNYFPVIKITNWNDDPSRAQSEVLDVFEKLGI
jgi:hypothetical protein